MADEILSRDPNRITVNSGVTNDADLDVVMFRVDPVTKRLLVDIETEDIATQTTLALIKAKTDNLDIAQSALNFPAGSGSNGTVTLTNATTAYSVPATASTKNHILVLYNGSDTDMYWGYATLTTGGILLASGATATIDLGASQTIFAYCSSSGKVITYSYKEIN